MRRSVRSMRHSVEGDTSFSAANCRTEFRAGDEATLAWIVRKVSGVPKRGLLPPLFLPSTFPVARNCSTNVFTVFVAGASLHLYWFWTGAGLWQSNLFAETIPQFEFSPLLLVAEPFWMMSSSSVAKYGKNTNVWRIRRYHLHRAVYFIVYRSTKIDSNWLKHPVQAWKNCHLSCVLESSHSFLGWKGRGFSVLHTFPTT
jgi:hypothetical protein